MSFESVRVPSFFLVAENRAAQAVIHDSANQEFRVQFREDDALHLEFYAERRTIELGRSGCAITLRDAHGAKISKRHCYFKYSLQTGAVVLYDQSQSGSTQVFDDDATMTVPMSQALHSVVVTRGFNRKIAIGANKYYRFKLKWGIETLKSFLRVNPQPHQYHQLGPLRTTYDPSKVRYIMGDELGRGACGTVTKAVDIHTGSAMAVKRFHGLEGKSHILAIREVNNMLKLSSGSRRNKHILPIFGFEFDSREYKWIEIFMPLKAGSVNSLILSPDRTISDAVIADEVLLQMLDALTYMAKHDIVHRDIKPDNILYDVRDKDSAPYYHFYLADFGLSNKEGKAISFVGTPQFMAPEVSQLRVHRQSDKTDIWSLFATIVWIYNTENFRNFPGPSSDVPKFLNHIAQEPQFTGLRDMAHENPRDRVSAIDLLLRLKSIPSTNTYDDHTPHPHFGEPDNDGQADWPYPVPISEETEARFASSNMYRVSVGLPPAPMDGTSALPDFISGTQDTYQVPRTSPYAPGQLGTDYLHYLSHHEEEYCEGHVVAEQEGGAE